MVEIVGTRLNNRVSLADALKSVDEGAFPRSDPYREAAAQENARKAQRIEDAHAGAADALRRGDLREYLAQSIMADRAASDAVGIGRAYAANAYGADDPRTTNAMVGAGGAYGDTPAGFREAQATTAPSRP